MKYSNNIKLKKGVKEYLERKSKEGARLFVLTASPHIVTDVCLKRNGVFELFEEVWSVEDYGIPKTDTNLFYKVADRIGEKPENISFFDDNMTAVINSKKSGYHTVGVYDAQTDEQIKEMKKHTDLFVYTFEELD